MMSSEKGLTVAVTGAAGYVAGRLIASLDADPRVGRIVGFDVLDPKIRSAKFVGDIMDIRDPAIAARLTGVDVLVHLAFVMDPIRNEPEMRDINVNGSQNVFRGALASGVRRIVYTSSATVYGAHPNNPVPLTEDAPLRANLDFSYPAHKLEVEYVIRELQEEFTDAAFTVFRPAIVFGSHVDNAWSHFLELPVQLAVRGYKPPLQFVHESDVSAALHHAVTHELEGIYNLAPDDWLTWDEVVGAVGKRVVQVAEPTAFALQERLWSFGLAEAPSGLLHYVMHPWVVSAAKLAQAGFSCRYSSSEALGETLDVTRDRVRLGSASVGTRAVKAGALASVGALSGFALVRGLRRRHKRSALVG